MNSIININMQDVTEMCMIGTGILLVVDDEEYYFFRRIIGDDDFSILSYGLRHNTIQSINFSCEMCWKSAYNATSIVW